MTNRSGLFKLSIIGFLCAIASVCSSCNSQPRQSDDAENGNIVLSSGERLYQGFIISGDTWDVYIADLNDLKDPYKRYRVQFAQNEFIDARLINQLHKEGVKIDWRMPRRVRADRLVEILFEVASTRIENAKPKFAPVGRRHSYWSPEFPGDGVTALISAP